MKGAQIAPNEALAKLRQSNDLFKTLFTHGSLEIEIYKPENVDYQQPHTRDEVYFIISGSGKFYCDGKTTNFDVGDVLFVPAGIEHRFEDFTEEFSTWVIFYGPEGGESPK